MGYFMLGERLRTILGAKKISVAQFAEMCDLPVETVKNIYYGKTPDPKISTVMMMAKALDMNLNCLIGECPHTVDEKSLLQYFRACGNHGKSIIILSAKYEALMARSQREAATKHTIPCMLPKGEIHNGIVYEDCETVEIETSVKEAYVGIRVTANCLMPTFCKGDILLFANRFPEHGEIGAFYVGERAFVRKYIEEEKQYRLQCLHNRSDDITVKHLSEIEYIGTYCGVIRT